jgi:hypothetical protein
MMVFEFMAAQYWFTQPIMNAKISNRRLFKLKKDNKYTEVKFA